MAIYWRGWNKFKYVEIVDGGTLAGLGVSPKGRTWYVDSVSGSANNDGKSWAGAKATIASAVALASAGDVIAIKGSFTEAVTVSLAGLTIIGAGTRPKEATWTSANDTACLTIAAEYVKVENIYFRPAAYTADRGACAIKLSGANHAIITNCRFQGKTGSQAAIYSPVCNSDNVTIEGCDFMYMNTATYGAAIKGVEAGGLSYSGWRILGNRFASCVTAIDICGRVCEIAYNSIYEYGITAASSVGAVLAMGIDLSGTSSGGNAVYCNQLGGTYGAPLYVVGASGDQWAGNYNVLSGGLTAANPA